MKNSSSPKTLVALFLLVCCLFCCAVWPVGASSRASAQDIDGGTGVLIARRPENPAVRRRIRQAGGAAPTPRPTRAPRSGGDSGGGGGGTAPDPNGGAGGETEAVNSQVEEAIERGNAARDGEPPRFAEAETAYRQAIELAPRDARAYGGLGNIYYDQRRWADAEPMFRRALELSRYDTVTPFYLAYANIELKRYEETERWAQRATELRPKEYYGYYLMGVGRLRRQDYRGAAEAYRRAIELSPTTPTLYQDLGRAYLADNRARDAAEVLRRGAALDESSVELQTLFAGALQKAALLDEAITQYDKLMRLDPRLSGPLSNLGIIYYMKSDAAKAREAWEAAAQKMGSRRTLDAAGLRALDGDARGALATLEQYVRQRPDSEAAWLMLSDVRRALGDEDGARAAYARGIETAPDYAKLTRPTLSVKASPASNNAAGEPSLDPKRADANGFTSLMTAAATGRADHVRTLLAAGAAPDAKDKKGGTALMYAAGQGHEGAVKALLEKNADVNSKDARGQTALMYGVGQGSVAVVRLLIEGGARADVKSQGNVTALKIAKSKKRDDLVELLKKAGAKD